MQPFLNPKRPFTRIRGSLAALAGLALFAVGPRPARAAATYYFAAAGDDASECTGSELGNQR